MQAPPETSERLRLFRSPPEIVALPSEERPRGRVAERVERRAAALDQQVATADPAELPFLSRSPSGRAFLGATPPRALARGEPARFCPAVGIAAGGASAERAADSALRACLADLDARARERGCGCRLLAVDDTLLAPRESFAYAPGVSGVVLGLPGLAGAPLAVEERAAGPGRRLVFFSAAGEVARARVAEGGRVTMRLADGRVLLGRSQPLGWRRGRLAEVLRLEGQAGERVAVLVGLEPEELAALAEAPAALPNGAAGL